MTSGRTQLGLALAITTMLAWGTLPVALSVLLRALEPITLTWFRFVLSSLVLIAILWPRGSLPRLADLGRDEWGLLAVAILGLVGNYVLFLLGLAMTTPANVQILIQLSPLLLSVGGMAIFGERYSRTQWIGFAILVSGLLVFFADQLSAAIDDTDRYLLGCGVIVAAAVLWAGYGLAQKQLLTRFSSPALMLCIYVGCALCLTPAVEYGQIAALTRWQLAVLFYCALNTVVGYGAFSASLQHLEASRVGAILALTPVATFGFIAISHAVSPGLLIAEHVSLPMVLGAAAVVTGSMLSSRG